MGTGFWAGLGIGAILSLIASIIANVLNAKINEFLDRRKLASQSNQYARARAFHDLIVELHTGERDKYLYLNRLGVRIVVGAVAMFTNFAVLGGVLALAPNKNGWPDPADHQDQVILLLFFSSMLFFYVYALATSRYRRITNALDRFTEFDANFNEKWASHLSTQN